MVEETLPSILASVYSWLTPAVLFLLISLVIGTIAVTSKAGAARHSDPNEAAASDGGGAEPRRLSRSSSVVLDRLRSFNLHQFRSPEILPPPLEALPAPRTEILEIPRFTPQPATETAGAEAAAEAEHDHLHHQLSRSQSDAHPTAGEMPPMQAVRMKKSPSEKSAFSHFEETEIVEPPATARAAVCPAPEEEEEGGGGGEVDARADDFINRFRQQLKLQRLDSIIRYKEMLNRSSV